MDELLSIGDFSARCGLSAKMLRSYAAAGLLVPAAVDGSSGYRYYSTVSWTRPGSSLCCAGGDRGRQIAEFFDDPDEVQLDRWDRQIVSESTARRRSALARPGRHWRWNHALPPTRPETSMERSREMPHTFVTGSATHIGGRETNEDAVLIGDGLFAVADGVGGLEDGEVASRLALDTLDAAFSADRTLSGLLDACRESNRAVWQQANGQDGTMGTTLVALASDLRRGCRSSSTSATHACTAFGTGASNNSRTTTPSSPICIGAGELREEDAHTHPYRYRPHPGDRCRPRRRHRSRWSLVPTRRPAAALQ